MLKTYKYQILAILFVAYSFGVWHVTRTYTKSSYQEQIIKTQEKDAKLSAEIGKAIEDKLGKLQVTNKTIYQEVIRETFKEPVYTDCVTTPDGVRLIEQAISAGK